MFPCLGEFPAKVAIAATGNREWLDKANRAVARHWKDRNFNYRQPK
jgi:hypothetical protein